LIWRLVVRRVATLREIEEAWSGADVLDANDALDLQDEVDALAAQPQPQE
jgi:hypothetical protein